jgi:hypothetical protein
MSLVWYEEAGEFPPAKEIDALSWAVGEDLTLNLLQVARDAKENARDAKWFEIKTKINVTPVAWSDILAVVVYVLVLRRGYYATFSWDGTNVTVLSAGRARDDLSENQAIELALRRYERIRTVSLDRANWQTHIARAR